MIRREKKQIAGLGARNQILLADASVVAHRALLNFYIGQGQGILFHARADLARPRVTGSYDGNLLLRLTPVLDFTKAAACTTHYFQI